MPKNTRVSYIGEEVSQVNLTFNKVVKDINDKEHILKTHLLNYCVFIKGVVIIIVN